MKIESVIRRHGGTAITLGTETYHFKPEAANEGAAHVAEVTDPFHIKLLLSIKEGYRRPGGEAYPETVASQSGESVTVTVAKPFTEAGLIAALDALGAANPSDLLGIAWPDLFPALADDASGLRAFRQAVLDPENQPSQYGTMLLARMPSAAALGDSDGGKPVGEPTTAPVVNLGGQHVITIGAIPPPDDAAKDDDKNSNQGASASTARLDALDDTALRAEFERVIGRKPHGRAQRETMTAQILSALGEG